MQDSVFTRRSLLQRGCMLASALATVPGFIERSAFATAPEGSTTGSRPGVPEDRILVVVQLAGGNDGLNTVIPYGDPAYHRERRNLSFREPGSTQGRAALELSRNAGLGLHPSLTDFRDLFDAGLLSIVQAVGYPNPNRSHFSSMDIWNAGVLGSTSTGWLGRYFDCTCRGTPGEIGSVAVTGSTPLALIGKKSVPLSYTGPAQFDWGGRHYSKDMAASREALLRATTPGSGTGDHREFLTRTSLDARIAGDRVTRAVGRAPLANYPWSPISNQLKTIAAMIREGLPTRVYYASQGGYDTHIEQEATHKTLLTHLGNAIGAFQRDLKLQGNDQRVLTLVFSEFGRRVSQNASGGTDHGTAAPVFLIGPNATPGVHGVHPSLTDLDSGDLRFKVDFRSVYASILEDWMRARSAQVLGGSFPNAGVVRTA